MRIEAYAQVQQLYGPRKTNRVASTASISSARDAVEISSLGQNLQMVKKAVKEAPDIREELTAPLKKSIEAGTYQVSGESFADKLMKKMGM
ncbi:MAG: flagellar biosynthesis anti-sigma factor FlgM [Lachnospiraceae bacterium]|nr:flagellar biosynthesis anti-sigma factor FlgM [Lachnospiraceae bacterium]